jgi:hypothetical protein
MKIQNYPNSYYLTTKHKQLQRMQVHCLHSVYGMTQKVFVFSNTGKVLFSWQIESSLSIRLHTKKPLQNSRLLQCTDTNGDSLPRMVGFRDFVLRKECDSRLFDKGECCSFCTLNETSWMLRLSLTKCDAAWFGNSSWLRHYATSRKVAGSIPDGVTGIFHLCNPSGRTMAVGSTQPLTEMSTRNISWG